MLENVFKSAEAERFINEIDDIILKNKARTFTEIAKSVGKSSQDFTDLKRGKKDLQRIFLDKVAAKYPIDKNYVLTGLRSDTYVRNVDAVDIGVKESNENYEKQIPSDFLNQIRVILDPKDTSSYVKPIPVYEHGYSSGEYISRLMNQTELLPSVILITGKLHIGCDMVIKHCDVAMTKALAPGCYIGIKKLHGFSRRIIPGMMGVVVLDEFTIERYVYPGDDPEHFLLRAAEPELHSDMEISIDEIKEMWQIKSYSLPIEFENLMH